MVGVSDRLEAAPYPETKQSGGDEAQHDVPERLGQHGDKRPFVADRTFPRSDCGEYGEQPDKDENDAARRVTDLRDEFDKGCLR
jgi:hypothetical protein